MSAALPTATQRGWRAALAAYRHAPVRIMLFLGYSSGLPFLLVLGTLSARLRQAHLDRSTIGYFSWVGLAYSLKFFWSPLVDRWALPALSPLGRRRSWMLLSQAGIVVGLLLMAVADPATATARMAWLAILTAFFAATQDIAIDAYRIEAADAALQGAMAASYQVGYQLALITAGAGALYAASAYGWTAAYGLMALLLGVGPVTVLLIREPPAAIDRATLAQEQRVIDFLERSAHWPAALRQSAAWLIGAVVCPFVDFIARHGLRGALPIIGLIVGYRLNYMTMGVAANTFYLDLGFTLDQIATVSKVYGVLMTLCGALCAGVLVARLGVYRTLLVGGLLLTAANLFYAYLAGLKPSVWWLAAAISLDNFGNGIAGAAFIAYLSSLTNVAYTATQYALFGTLWSLPAKSLAGWWGNIVDAFGYPAFFVYTAAVGLPALLLILWFMRRPPTAAQEQG